MHVTLTRENLSTICADDVRALKSGFKQLRRRDIWANNVVGGIMGVELTNTGRGWHPHLHCLCDCEWLAIATPRPKSYHSRAHKKNLFQRASQELMEEWSDCIGQLLSSIKVRRCSGEVAVREVLKYAVKAGDLIDSPDPIGDAIRAISGGRLSTPFGSLYALRKELTEAKRPAFKCPSCAQPGTMIPEAVAERIQTAARRDRSKRRRR